MVKKAISYFWSVRKQFVNYFITGISGTILDIGLLFLLVNVLQMRPALAVALNQIVVLVYIFCLNKYWTFCASGMTHRQLARFLLVYVGNYTFAILWMWFFTEVFSLRAGFGEVYLLLEIYYNLIVRLANIALSICWNFFLYKYFVYKPEKVSGSTLN